MEPAPLPPPGKLLLVAELPRAAWTLVEAAAARSRLAQAPRGDGRPILVLPGVAMGDSSVAPLTRYLRRLGHAAESWRLGINRGTPTIGADAEKLLARVEALHDRHDAPVTLIGISLGGIMARLAAHRRPDLVREVITICSPYAAGGRATNAWRTYQWLSGESIDGDMVRARLAEVRRPLPVPATALWSRTDGMVNGMACRVPGEPGLGIVEIAGGHLLAHLRPAVWEIVAARLAATPDA